ncbi:MAG: SMP-30/gluconolactonase/LRE family protein [Blastocatellia bacterium]|nr:SMP-30/gluconolactonase/LRE family protein [Blastocatellia bacterium]
MKHLIGVSFFLLSLFIFIHFDFFHLTSPWFSHAQRSSRFLPAATQLKISQANPVVNENKKITLTAVDETGAAASDVTWESGSPDVATVDAKTGIVTGVSYGYATITARTSGASVSSFVVVAKVKNGKGASVPGDTQTDTGGRFYISDPSNSVIYQKDGLLAAASVYAGQTGSRGRLDGSRLASRFAGPTAIGVDNGAQGGVYVADTLNHCIRKISGDLVTTAVGTGSPGTMTADSTPFAQAVFSSPRGIVADTGGNLYVADTNNHAIFYVDFAKQEVRLVAGSPGQSGLLDGAGKTARFTRPAGIALSSDGKLIAVADEGNNVVRLVSPAGAVATLGKASSRGGSPLFEPALAGKFSETQLRAEDEAGDELVFNAPQSVGIDSTGNIYVVDKSNAKVVTRPLGKSVEVVSVAQDAVSFSQAASVTIRGYDSIVLDQGATSPDEAIKVVSIGPPQITSVTETVALVSPQIPLEGGTQIVVEGKNFAPETQVFVGDGQAVNLQIESATRLTFQVPPQKSPGRKTLSVATRGGVDQSVINIIPKAFSELAAGEITTYAGGVQFLGDGGLGTQANSGTVSDLFIDGVGNLYLVDGFNSRIRRLDVNSNIITSVTGNGTSDFSPDGTVALGAGLNNPTTVTVDSQGNIIFSDNSYIRRIDARTGLLSTVAGVREDGFSGDGGPATSAKLSKPKDVALDVDGNLFIADTGNNRIRRVDAKTGLITTVAGNGKATFDQDNVSATQAALNSPSGVILDDKRNLYITDQRNNRIRRVDAATGIISTVAGNGKLGFDGDNGPAKNASLGLGMGEGGGSGSIGLDRSGNLVIADAFNHRVRRVDAKTGIITTLAGNGNPTYSGDGGPALAAALTGPFSVAVDGLGNVVVFDSGNSRVRRIDAITGIITTVVGKSFENGDGGQAVGANLNGPAAAIFDTKGNLLVCDTRNHQIRKVDGVTGVITTLAGTGSPGFAGDNGPATKALLNQPQGLAVDPRGNIFVSDSLNNRIRRIDTSTGTIVTVAGTGRPGFMGDGMNALMAELDTPTALALDEKGFIYIADSRNHRIRRLDFNAGTMSTYAGNGSPTTSNDGGPALTAGIPMPNSLALDPMGNLFVGTDNRVRRIDTRGMITPVAGNGMPVSGADGGFAGSTSLIVSGVAFSTTGDLLVAETLNKVRRISMQGTVSTVAGTGSLGYSGDNGKAIEARLNTPMGIAFDPAGNLYIADQGNNSIRFVKGVGRGNNVPPAITPIADQTLDPGTVRSLKVTALDLNDVNGVKLTLNTSLGYVTLTDKGKGEGILRIAPAATEKQSGRVTISAQDPDGLTAQIAFAVNVLPNSAPTLAVIADQAVFFGETRTLFAMAMDRNGVAGVKLSLVAPPTYATLTDMGNGIGSIRLTPKTGDTAATLTVQAVDVGGLTAQTSFKVTVTANTPPALASIANQTLRSGEVKLVSYTATDAESPGSLRVNLVNPPRYATLVDNGNGTGVVRLAPVEGDNTGTVALQVTDSGGLTAQVTFTVTVQPAAPKLTISNVTFVSPALTITGTGFGTSENTVTINGTDVSQFIKSQSATSISLKGKAKKLNLKTGTNQIVVTAGGVASNSFSFTL